MKVLVLPEVRQYLKELSHILYEEKYFSFLEASERYLKELFDEISETLHRRLHKPAPEYFSTYGKEMEYAAFKKNKQTTWYVFFETYKEREEIIYLVRYITNNHVIVKYL